MDASFTSPYMYMIGMDTDGASDSQLEEFNSFYNDTHMGEVVAMTPGFVRAHRYELAKPDPRDWYSLPWQPTDYAAEIDAPLKGKRIAFSPFMICIVIGCSRQACLPTRSTSS